MIKREPLRSPNVRELRTLKNLVFYIKPRNIESEGFVIHPDQTTRGSARPEGDRTYFAICGALQLHLFLDTAKAQWGMEALNDWFEHQKKLDAQASEETKVEPGEALHDALV